MDGEIMIGRASRTHIMQAILLFAVILIGIAVMAPAVSAADWKDTAIDTLTAQNWKDMVSNNTVVSNSTIVMNNGTAVPWLNLTTSWTPLTVQGSQSLNFTMPRAGTYLIEANIRENSTAIAGAGAVFSEYALCDAGNSNIVTNSERMAGRLTELGNVTTPSKHLTWLYTNATATQVSVCGRISTSVNGRWAVASDADGRSTLIYVRMA